MTDAIQVWGPQFKVLDDSGDPEAGAIIYFYDAGTTSPRTVYTDSSLSTSAGTSVTCDSSGTPQVSGSDVLIYTGTTAYKVIITDSSGSLIQTLDNIKGAIDTSGFLTATTGWSMPVVAKTADYTVLTTDLGSLISADSTSATVTLTLPSVASSGDGAMLAVRKASASNSVVIDGNGGETINGSATYTITTNKAAIVLVCDGAEWFPIAEFDGT